MARELLKGGALPIVEIARRTGFATHAHFSTRFRQTVGSTPAEYRRRHRS
ncbi:helix-turn-helix domain-containing protein [Glacieibacterium frigidum]|uniref:Helix-turn-helix domain-containing protein n=1 Tax=Glacieibacterium frigidum TaxID=2593303 RepID=A0A552UH46_9SPHN|nr:helix-turn-helix domain-containing protein [Glacieibacterium frigidum]